MSAGTLRAPAVERPRTTPSGSSDDAVQAAFTRFVDELSFSDLPPAAIHAAKVRIIDTLAALLGGFDSDSSELTRRVASRLADPSGATILGTSAKVPVDWAAFANATAARYVELNDVYHWPGSSGGHPSDVIAPILAVAEQTRASGRDLIVAVIAAYEIYLRLSDAIARSHLDCANFARIGVAAACAKLMGLSSNELSHAIAIAATTGNVLTQVRSGHLSMWKAVAAGEAGRSGVMSAQLAAMGLDGAHLPFEGVEGWCRCAIGKPFALPPMSAADVIIERTLIKRRASCATTISSILAAEPVASQLRGDHASISRVVVEVYKRAKVFMGTGEHHWNPHSRETADHSIPYVVAACLVDGTITPRQFDREHIESETIRKVLAKIEVVENEEFTREYDAVPVIHRTRVRAWLDDGRILTGESGGEKGDLSNPPTDREIDEKFMMLAREPLGESRAAQLLGTLWKLDDLGDVSAIPRALQFA